MLPDRVSNPGPLTYESGALPIALCGPASPLVHIIFYLMLDFYVKTGIRFSFRDKRLFEITEVEITRVDCSRDGLNKS